LRFEIVGALVASFDMRRECEVSNVGAGGALIDMPDFVSIGANVAGSMLLGERPHDVSGVVRHIRPHASRDGEVSGYLVGLDFHEPVPEFAEQVKARELKPLTATVADERRATERYECDAGVRIQFPFWATVEIQDISAGGVMFTTASGFATGSRGQIRMRVGERRFAAEVKVWWTESSASAPPLRVGASFMSMDPESRAALVSLLTPGGPVIG